MAKITHVAKAQQRYAMVPVLDSEGNQKTVAVNKATKTGRAIVKRITVADKSQPLPPHTCDSCHKPIEVGTSYKHISPRSGPFGGRTLYRHEDCPTWMPWDYSSSMSARLGQISFIFSEELAACTDDDDVTMTLSVTAEAVRELATEKQESADNVEEGFGHATQMSEELTETADALHAWADEIETADFPAKPEPEEVECDECEGEGTVGNDDPDRLADDPETKACEKCGGDGNYTPEELDDEALDAWRDELAGELTIVDEAPV